LSVSRSPGKADREGVALVTGAAGGIGRAISERFAREGQTVLLTDIDEGAVRAVADQIGGDAHALLHDVTKAEDWDAAITRARELGGLAALVNNAGVVRDSTLRKMSEEQWDFVLDVHLRAAFLGCQASVREWADAGGGGRIVNIASIAYLGAFGQANYAAAKGGIVSLTRTVAVEGARYGVLCNAVAPGNVNTPMFNSIPQEFRDKFIAETPLARLGEPAEIASVVWFLTSQDASYVTGQVIHVDGGVTAQP
jgi:3-oxoacyl-[acyl-carrier protein] reductase